jgi:hypothetical protein
VAGRGELPQFWQSARMATLQADAHGLLSMLMVMHCRMETLQRNRSKC